MHSVSRPHWVGVSVDQTGDDGAGSAQVDHVVEAGRVVTRRDGGIRPDVADETIAEGERRMYVND